MSVLFKNITLLQQPLLINIMATIESLDLAQLLNNPQSISEALEDALETTNGTIGTLKTEAQNKKNDIDVLYNDALIVKNNIDALFSSQSSIESYYTDSLLDNFVAWDNDANLTDEHGMSVFRWHKLYIFHLMMYRTGTSTSGQHVSTIKTLTSSDITLPTNDVNCGIGLVGDVAHDDRVTRVNFKSDGSVNIHYYNTADSTMLIFGNFIGIDQG